MNKRILNLSTFLLTIVSLAALAYWLLYDPTAHFTELRPGMDGRPAELQAAAGVRIGSFFRLLNPIVPPASGAWPRFRGERFDNISRDSYRLAERWPEGGPKVLWSVDLGEGHAGPAVADGRVYVLDYDEENRRDLLRCFALVDGTELWQRGYDIYTKRNHGMSRTVPAIADSFVVTIGPQCQVMCVNRFSGEFRWGLDIAAEFKAEVPLWYTGQCPLIDDGQVILGTGGSALLVGVDLRSGEILWQTPNPAGWKMSHSSVMPMTLHGKRMYVYAAIGGIVGVSAEREDRGRVLFSSSAWAPNVIAPSPIHLGEGRIFFTAGYGNGAAVFQIRRSGDDFTAELLQAYKPDQGLCSEQQTPILFQGCLFSILPKDAGAKRNRFVCAAANAPEKIVWSSEGEWRFGLGPYLLADGKFFILSDDGELTMARATTAGFQPLARAKVLSGSDAWGPMALVDGRLLCRDSRRLICLDMRG